MKHFNFCFCVDFLSDWCKLKKPGISIRQSTSDPLALFKFLFLTKDLSLKLLTDLINDLAKVVILVWLIKVIHVACLNDCLDKIYRGHFEDESDHLDEKVWIHVAFYSRLLSNELGFAFDGKLGTLPADIVSKDCHLFPVYLILFLVSVSSEVAWLNQFLKTEFWIFVWVPGLYVIKMTDKESINFRDLQTVSLTTELKEVFQFGLSEGKINLVLMQSIDFAWDLSFLLLMLLVSVVALLIILSFSFQKL